MISDDLNTFLPTRPVRIDRQSMVMVSVSKRGAIQSVFVTGLGVMLNIKVDSIR